jgi:hypothetical protein
MRQIRFLFTCGHEQEATGSETERPLCAACGASMDRVLAPKPAIRGACESPLKRGEA